jgi:hypothetical protein
MKPTKEDLANDIRDVAKKIFTDARLPSLIKMDLGDLEKLATVMEELTKHERL